MDDQWAQLLTIPCTGGHTVHKGSVGLAAPWRLRPEISAGSRSRAMSDPARSNRHHTRAIGPLHLGSWFQNVARIKIAGPKIRDATPRPRDSSARWPVDFSSAVVDPNVSGELLARSEDHPIYKSSRLLKTTLSAITKRTQW